MRGTELLSRHCIAAAREKAGKHGIPPAKHTQPAAEQLEGSRQERAGESCMARPNKWSRRVNPRHAVQCRKVFFGRQR
jgi:hypothetical protein